MKTMTTTTIKLPSDFELYTENALEEVQFCMTGAGWASDDYVMNFTDELSNEDKFRVLLLLSLFGKLHDEEKMSVEECESEKEPSAKSRMTPEQVQLIYSEKLLNN